MSLDICFEEAMPYTPILDRGISDDAREIRRSFSGASNLSPSMALGDFRRKLLEELISAVGEVQEEGWDGYEARPVDPSAFGYAIQFMSGLDSSLPLPEIGVDTDGDIAFEWDYGPRRVISIRIGRDGTIHYAGLIGHEPFHGTEFLHEEIPLAISSGIERVVEAA